jgi:hypothetical protein
MHESIGGIHAPVSYIYLHEALNASLKKKAAL